MESVEAQRADKRPSSVTLWEKLVPVGTGSADGAEQFSFSF